MARLASYVHVAGVVHPPGDVPAAIAEQITNPKAWESVDSPDPADASLPVRRRK